jgi:hypothetical protein
MTGRTYLTSALSTATLLGVACRFGGPEGSATELQEVDAGRVVAEPDDDSVLDDSSDIEDPMIVDAQPLAPPAAGFDAATPSAPEASVLACSADSGLACDPLSGLGCLPLMQCVIDPSGSTPTANCVFSGLLLEETCTEDALSTNCPPLHTCVVGECLKYCCDDADCEGGATCVAARGAGAAVFKLCQPLTP